MTCRNKLYERAIDVVLHGDVKPDGIPILFTSCCLPIADKFVADYPQYAPIHSSAAGKKLEELDLFSHMPFQIAYLHWFFLSARYAVENDFHEDVLFFGDLDNPRSLAFGIEIPLLYHAKPNVHSITNPLIDRTLYKDQWLQHGLMRPYVLALSNYWLLGEAQKPLSAEKSLLMQSFGLSADGRPTSIAPVDARIETGLKLMISSYLGSKGNFPTDPIRGHHPLSLSLGGGT
ncbi:MAG TPA: hypothetical protein PKI93_07795 [Alphaproteobacteria bacterium]|nr:hypothetical protein [Alphaproteobacteria bacterium]HNS44960.1 hypothetical protein [Alphaproteobacteria bacterium]